MKNTGRIKFVNDLYYDFKIINFFFLYPLVSY